MIRPHHPESKAAIREGSEPRPYQDGTVPAVWGLLKIRSFFYGRKRIDMEKAQKKNAANLDPIRHSAAHLLAAAVTKLWPNAKPAISPAIENGFYYDFDFGKVKISESGFPKPDKARLGNYKQSLF